MRFGVAGQNCTFLASQPSTREVAENSPSRRLRYKALMLASSLAMKKEPAQILRVSPVCGDFVRSYYNKREQPPQVLDVTIMYKKKRKAFFLI